VLEGHQLPPDVTFGGMKTGLLRMEIEESWRKIKLTDASGMPLPQTIRIETIEGSIEITLRPEFAPNHVRNMIALTRAGFYDGLQFERVVHQQSELDGQTTRLDMVIAGCPTGTGDDGFGHIGYFMRSEFQQHVKHEAGTVGFWHEEDPDSAGCRFYITLGPAPLLDGKFTIIGSVSKGLDAVHRIASAPRQSVDVSPENEKPIAPIAIKKASVVELADKNMN
jgi:cyclophilin family peptidyl-prolyl cis-trans isomerase